MSHSLWLHRLQLIRPLCASLSPRVFSNSCPLRQWCLPTIFSSAAHSSPALNLSFLASGSFPMSRLFISGGQSIGASASASVLPMNTQGWFPFGWTGLISLQSKALSRVFSNNSLKASILQCSAIYMVQLSHPYMTTGKTIALSTGTFVGKRMSPFFNTQSCFGALGKCKAFSEGWSCLVGYSQTVGVVSTARSSDGGPQKIHSLLDWWPLHWVEGARDLSLRTYSIILSCV